MKVNHQSKQPFNQTKTTRRIINKQQQQKKASFLSFLFFFFAILFSKTSLVIVFVFVFNLLVFFMLKTKQKFMSFCVFVGTILTTGII